MTTDTRALAGALLLFVISAAAVTVAGTRLAREGDVIAARTRLGGVWVGAVFLALATSLPELMTSISAALLGAVDLAAGNLFGSSMSNMLVLALLTLMPAGSNLFGRAALDHVTAGALAIVLNCMAGAFAVANLPYSIGGVGAGSLVLLTVYLLGTRLLFLHTSISREAAAVAELEAPAEAASTGSATARPLRHAVLGFVLAAILITAAAPLFAGSAERIADLTGVGQTLIGTSLVGLATSLPEFVTSLAAVRMGAFDLAVGNLFGSNAVNMLMFAPLDVAHRAGPVFGAISSAHAISAFTAIAMMAMSLVALVQRAQRRFSILEPSGFGLVVLYLLGLLLVAWRS